MATPTGSILPDSYFDGLSSLWGGCAYLGSALVATGLVFQAINGKPDPVRYIWLFSKLLLIAVATLFIREWLMRLNDVVIAFAQMMGADPLAVDNKFVTFISGKTGGSPNASVWDVIWGTTSIGTAISYALLWFFGWLAWSLQYVVKLIGGILLTAGWALSPIFLAFFMIRPMAGVALKYVLGLVALVCWPFGWVMAAVVTNAMLDAAATASLIPVALPGSSLVAPILTVLLIGTWMIVSSLLAPYVTTRVLLTGANPAAAFAQGVGEVAQASLAAGVGTATAAVSGGATTGGVIAAAALGAMSGGVESAARGGGTPTTTSTVAGGMSGFYRGQFLRKQTEAMQEMAAADTRRADATEEFNKQFRGRMQKNAQPHHPDPNQAAIDIDTHVKS